MLLLKAEEKCLTQCHNFQDKIANQVVNCNALKQDKHFQAPDIIRGVFYPLRPVK